MNSDLITTAWRVGVRSLVRRSIELLALTAFLFTCPLYASDRDEAPVTAQPEVSGAASDSESLQKLEALHKHRVYTIGVMEDFVRRYPKSEELSNIFYELGSNYYEEARYQELKAIDKSTPESERKFFQKTSERLKQKAVLTFEKLIERFPDHPHMASILYAVADAYTALGRADRASRYFRQITERFPNSTEASHSMLMVADSYFEDNRFQSALEAYQSALSKMKDKRAYAYARFKVAWCFYNLGRHSESLSGFRAIISGLKNLPPDTRKNYFYDEALLDIVNPYSEVRDASEAHSYFGSFLSGDELKDLLYRLATLYHHHAKFSGAETLLTEIFNSYPNDPDAVRWLKKLIEIYAATGKKEKIVATIGTLKKMSASRPAVEGTDDKAEISDESAGLLSKLAAQAHKRAQKGKRKKDYDEAVAYYRAYISLFPDNPKVADVRFFLAEALYGAGDLNQAYREYETVKNDSRASEANRRDAILAMIVTLEKQSEVFKSTLTKPKAHLASADALPEEDRKLTALYEEQARGAAEDAQLIPILFKLGSIYYYYGLGREAEEVLSKVASSSAKPDLAKTSANLILNIHTLKGNYEEIAETARKLKNSTAVADIEFKRDLNKIEQQALFKTIEKAERQGSAIEAAQKYEAFTKSYPSSPYTDKAFYNSILNYTRIGDFDSAVRVEREMARAQRSSPLLKKALIMLAKQLASIGEYQRAAGAFESFAKAYSSDLEAAQAMYNAIIFKQALGDLNGAISGSEIYLRRFGSKKHAEEIDFRLIQLYQEAGRTEDVIHQVARFTSKISPREAQYYRARLIKAHVLEESARIDEYRSILAKYNQSGKPRSVGAIVGEALFHILQLKHERFTEINFSQGNLTAATKRKLALLDELKKDYTDVIKLGQGRWGIAALVKLGDAYNEFANALLDAPVPSQLTESQIEQYRTLLRKQTSEILDKAKEAYRKAIQKSFELQIYSEWLNESSKQLKALGVQPFAAVSEAPAGERLAEGETMTLDEAKAILIKSPNAAAMNVLGNSFYQAGKMRLAELTYTIGTKLFPKYSAFYNNLGLCAEQSKDIDSAIAYWNKSLTLNFRQLEARQNLAAVAAQFNDQKSLGNQLRRINELSGS